MIKTKIPIFETFNDFYQGIGLEHQSQIPDFDIVTIESLEPTARRCMPPYRQGFYQIALMSNYGKTQFNLNTDLLNLEGFQVFNLVSGG